MSIAIGAAIALVLYLTQTLLGWPPSLRFWVGGILIVLGSLMFGSNPSGVLYDKGRVMAVTDDDMAQLRASRRSNISSGVRLFLIGVVILASTFLFP